MNDPSSSTWMIQAGEYLQQVAKGAIRLGRTGIVLITPLFVGYVLLGGIVTWSGTATFPYPFLSVTSDPVFNLLGFISGLALAFGSGGLLILLLMNDFDRVGNQLAMLLLGISFASSIAILRHTHETAFRTFVLVYQYMAATMDMA